MSAGLIVLLIGVVALAFLLAFILARKVTRRVMPDFPDARTARQEFIRKTGIDRESVDQAETLLKGRNNNYQIIRTIGRGSMGVVFLGAEVETGRQVAIKTLALEEETDSDQIADIRARFFREAETAGRLKQPCIVDILDSGELHNLAWIAMEYLPGQSLEAWTSPDKLLPLSDVLALVRQVALALDYAHMQKVVHRDIKPGNIVYDPNTGKVTVTDFGVARMTDINRTRTGLVLGTPAFMSPEQLAGRRIDGRSDLFSLGALLYQLSTGHLPFAGDSLGTLMYSISHNQPEDPKKYKPALPAALVAIIMKALQKDVSARFQSGAQFALALARLEATMKGKQTHA